MKFEDIVELAKKDLLSDQEVDLDSAALKVPSLVHRWSEIQFHEKLSLKKYEKEYSQWKRILWEYYNGKMSQEDLKKYGLEQFNLKILKKDAEVYIDSDPKLLDIEDKIIVQQEKVDFIDRKLKEIGNRQWLIRAAIDHRKFMSGA